MTISDRYRLHEWIKEKWDNGYYPGTFKVISVAEDKGIDIKEDEADELLDEVIS